MLSLQISHLCPNAALRHAIECCMSRERLRDRASSGEASRPCRASVVGWHGRTAGWTSNKLKIKVMQRRNETTLFRLFLGVIFSHCRRTWRSTSFSIRKAMMILRVAGVYSASILQDGDNCSYDAKSHTGPKPTQRSVTGEKKTCLIRQSGLWQQINLELGPRQNSIAEAT